MSDIDAIGLVADVLGIFTFFHQGVADGPSGATVRIRAGHAYDVATQNYGGQIYAIDGYDNFNGLKGSASGGHVDDDSYTDFVINQDNPRGQIQYVTVRNDNDATCVEYVTLANVDDVLPKGAWTGDIGYSCGESWFYGNTSLGRDSQKELVYPKCTWLDADHTNGLKSGAMKIDFLAYGEKVSDTLNNGYSCSATSFTNENGQIDAPPSGKRSVESRTTHGSSRKPWMEDQIIVSTLKGQTAKHLCEHPMSWGSDFIGVDGYFCDMKTHTLSPLCSTLKVPGCVSLDNKDVKRTVRDAASTQWKEEVHRSYSRILQYHA